MTAETCNNVGVTGIIEKALALALEVHAGQVDKQGAPYILHPIEVARRVGWDDELGAATALLHDVYEDGPEGTGAKLKAAGIDWRVLQAVSVLTRATGEAYEDYIERVARNPLARRVKLRDLGHNLDARRGPVPEDRREKYEAAWDRLQRIEFAAEWADDDKGG